eukprot:g2964.t1
MLEKMCDKPTKTRPVTCYDGNANAAVKLEETTASCSEAKPPLQETCNAFECVTYTWKVGAYQACTKTCGGGVQYRKVECSASDGSIVTDPGKKCGMDSKPSAITACSTQKCDPCESQRCSGNGKCTSDESGFKCTCDPGFKGVTCAVEESCDGVKDYNGLCCAKDADGLGGVLDGQGKCCDGKLGSAGTCCGKGKTMDACGICGGKGIGYDVKGTCCQPPYGAPAGTVPQFDEQKVCCPDGKFDACGVCGGDNSCNVGQAVTTEMPQNEKPLARRRLTAPTEAEVQAFVTNPVSSNSLKEGLVTEASNNVGVDESAVAITLKAVGTKIEATLEFDQEAIAASGGIAVDPLTLGSKIQGDSGTGVLASSEGAIVAFTTGLGGFSKDTFDVAAQTAYKAALSKEAAVPAASIKLKNIQDIAERRRLELIGADKYSVRTTGRRLTTLGVKFGVEVTVTDSAAGTAVKGKVEAVRVDDSDFKKKLEAEFDKASLPYDKAAFTAFDLRAATKAPEVRASALDAGTAEATPAPPASGENNTPMISGISVGAVTVVCLSLYAYCRRKRHQEKSKMLDHGAYHAQRQDPSDDVMQGKSMGAVV